MTGYVSLNAKKKIPPPTKGGVAVGILGGQKNQKSGKCHELSRKKLFLTHPTLGGGGVGGKNLHYVTEKLR